MSHFETLKDDGLDVKRQFSSSAYYFSITDNLFALACIDFAITFHVNYTIEQRKIIAATVLSLATAICVAMSNYHQHLNADTLIVYFNALLRWRPFFWNQDRYGMLIPGLTVFIKDPVLNVITQSALHITCSLASFFLLSRYLFERSKWFEVGTLAFLLFVSFTGFGDLENFLSPWQIYTPAMAFGLAAYLNVRRSFPLALLFMFISQWCNFAVALFLALLTAVTFLEQLPRVSAPAILKARQETLLLILSAVVGYFMRLPFRTAQSANYSPGSLYESLTGWIELFRSYASSPRSSLAMALAPPLLALIAFTIHRFFAGPSIKAQTQVLRIGLAASLCGLAYAMVAGASQFAKWNGYPPRYLIPTFMLWAVGFSGIVIGYRWKNFPRVLAYLPAGLILAVLMGRFSPPSMSAVKGALATRLQHRYEELAQARCTHVTGDYYRVWESVFYSRVKGGPKLWGITGRANVIRDLWDLSNFKHPRICFWNSNANEAKEILEEFNMPALKQIDTVGDIIVMEPLGNLADRSSL